MIVCGLSIPGAIAAPPSYSELFPVKELQAEVNHAREDGVTPSVPLKICEMFCKSSKLLKYSGQVLLSC